MFLLLKTFRIDINRLVFSLKVCRTACEVTRTKKTFLCDLVQASSLSGSRCAPYCSSCQAARWAGQCQLVYQGAHLPGRLARLRVSLLWVSSCPASVSTASIRSSLSSERSSIWEDASTELWHTGTAILHQALSTAASRLKTRVKVSLLYNTFVLAWSPASTSCCDVAQSLSWSLWRENKRVNSADLKLHRQ